MTIQYAGALQVLERALEKDGWERGAAIGWDNLIKLLSPSLPLRDLPLIPHVHDGHHESLTLVKPLGEDRRQVLRLWATPYRIAHQQAPIWVGNVTEQGKKVILDLIVVPATERDDVTLAMDGLTELHPYRPAEGAPLLLQERPITP